MTTSKPLSNGTRTRVQAARRRDFLPDTGRDTSNNSRLLLPNTTQTTNRVRRRPGPRWKDPEYQRRRTTNPTKKERIPSPRTILRQLLRQEKRRTLSSNPGQFGHLESTLSKLAEGMICKLAELSKS